MEKLNHTPGPWHAATEPDRVYADKKNTLGNIVCFPPTYWDKSMEFWPANARLIAKSPELYAHHIKDIENLRGLMEVVNVPVPVDTSAAQIIQAMIDQKEALLNSI